MLTDFQEEMEKIKAYTLQSGSFSLTLRAIPVTVPPVPAPMTTISNLPAQINPNKPNYR